MYLSPSSPSAVRFYAAIGDGLGLKAASRLIGVHHSVGDRFLRAAYLDRRRAGMSPVEALAEIGFQSSHAAEWELQVEKGDRHHLRVDVEDEDRFWALFFSGMRPAEVGSE